ncbi:family 1 glycosylhydrolase [Streptomyces sp. NPDC048196]|uniref:family 1 glycosylhydrolase n=1 Tax=Streptomyces sp. NPDC048196 TaxID=3154712 RepID=UPI0033EA7906
MCREALGGEERRDRTDRCRRPAGRLRPGRGHVGPSDRGAVEGLRRAARRGAPLAGHFAWSLIDTFGWAHGHGKRFGLLHVGHAPRARTLKAGGRHYAGLIRRHRPTR